jgi:hypothetical protein
LVGRGWCRRIDEETIKCAGPIERRQEQDQRAGDRERRVQALRQGEAVEHLHDGEGAPKRSASTLDRMPASMSSAPNRIMTLRASREAITQMMPYQT